MAALLLLGAAILAAGLAAPPDRSGGAGVATVELANGIPDRATVLDFARGQGISLEDAVSAFRDTKAILDFKGASSNDPRFGDVWADYDRDYRVHVRSLDPSFTRAIDRFEKKLGRPVFRHLGGASATDMGFLIERLRREAPTVGWRTNVQEGVIEVYESGVPLLLPSLLGSEFIRVDPGIPARRSTRCEIGAPPPQRWTADVPAVSALAAGGTSSRS